MSTHVDFKVSIVNVDAVDSLLEVDMANAVDIKVVVVNHAELGVRSKSLDSSGSSGYVVTLEVHRLDRSLVFDIDVS